MPSSESGRSVESMDDHRQIKSVISTNNKVLLSKLRELPHMMHSDDDSDDDKENDERDWRKRETAVKQRSSNYTSSKSRRSDSDEDRNRNGRSPRHRHFNKEYNQRRRLPYRDLDRPASEEDEHLDAYHTRKEKSHDKDNDEDDQFSQENNSDGRSTQRDARRNIDKRTSERRKRHRHDDSESDHDRHSRPRRHRESPEGSGNEKYSDRRRKRRHGRESSDEERKRTEVASTTDTNVDGVKNIESIDKPVEKKKKTIEDLFTKSGGAYIPPSKLRELQEGITDKTSIAYQRMAWEALKKSINGLVNKVNVSNIGHIVEELLQENVVRGRGLLSQSIIRAQVASPTFSNVYAGLVSIINTKFPKVGELILRRLIINFRRSFKRNDKSVCINSAKFIAHLVNQQVAHELLSLEILTLLLQNPTGDSVEVAKLNELLMSTVEKHKPLLLAAVYKPQLTLGLFFLKRSVFERLRTILHESETERRVQYMIEVMFAIRKDGFKDFPSVLEDLDLVEEDDQITHLLRLDDTGSAEDMLNVFKHDPEFEENEEKYKQIKQDILGGSDDESSEDDDDDDEDDDDEEGEEGEDGENKEEAKMEIIDKTETNLVALRRLIYLTVQSSLDFEECAHKMMKIDLKPGQEHEFCLMVVECCAQQRSYEKFFGLLGQRFCLLKKEFMEQYAVLFKEQYEGCHHLETNRLRNTAKFFSHLIHSDAIPWTVMESIRLNEDDTTSSSRIFIKILFQELAEYLGIKKFNDRLREPIVAPYLEGIFPRDNPRDTRFAINFFTAIGLGGLTDELREHLKKMPKVNVLAQQLAEQQDSSSSSSSSDSDSSSDDSSSDSSNSDSSDSDNEKDKKGKRQRKKSSPKQKNRRENERTNRQRSESQEEDRLQKKHSGRMMSEITRTRNDKRDRDQESPEPDRNTRQEQERDRNARNRDHDRNSEERERNTRHRDRNTRDRDRNSEEREDHSRNLDRNARNRDRKLEEREEHARNRDRNTRDRDRTSEEQDENTRNRNRNQRNRDRESEEREEHARNRDRNTRDRDGNSEERDESTRNRNRNARGRDRNSEEREEHTRNRDRNTRDRDNSEERDRNRKNRDSDRTRRNKNESSPDRRRR